MAGRTKRIQLDESWREKIQIGVIMDRLIKHVHGEIEMSATQINAAKILLGKVAPDLSKTEIAGDDENPLTIISRIERVIVDSTKES